jgi:hypothetical protein
VNVSRERKEQGRKHADDGDNYQQFHKREGAIPVI